MDARVAQNALGFFLSDRVTYKGPDIMALVEIIRELQVEIKHGTQKDPTGGDSETPSR